jgi:hypothetical protein
MREATTGAIVDRRRCPARRYQIKSLSEPHQRILTLRLRGLGVGAIAAAVRMSRSQVGAVLGSELARAELRRLRTRMEAALIMDEAAIRREVERLAVEGLHELAALLESKDTGDRLRAAICMDLLDRGGFKAPDRHEVTIDYAAAIMSAFERRRARQRAQEASEPSPDGLPGP